MRKMKKENPLLNIEGDKLRRQYFSGAVTFLGVLVLFALYCEIITEEDFDFGVPAYIFICVPFLVLSYFNRRSFGRVVCVMNSDGIHYCGGFVAWEDVYRLEYAVKMPSSPEYVTCYAIVYTKGDDVIINYAPRSILSCAKKYRPDITARLSTASRIEFFLFIALMFVFVSVYAMINK